MIHQTGDLLWVPQMAMLYKGPNNPMAVRWNEKPKIALFIENASYEGYIKINIEGEQWVVQETQIRKFKGERNVSKVS